MAIVVVLLAHRQKWHSRGSGVAKLSSSHAGTRLDVSCEPTVGRDAASIRQPSPTQDVVVILDSVVTRSHVYVHTTYSRDTECAGSTGV